jgi:hypothetical protein
MVEKSFRITLKLAAGKSPHIYLEQLKEIMKNDTSLHPMMKKTLKMLKLTRIPYIMLANTREIVIDPMNFRHFDRSVEPKGDWICTLWGESEIEQHKKNPEEHIKAILKLFESLGYELYNSKTCSLEYVQSLEELTSGQIESQLKGREKE